MKTKNRLKKGIALGMSMVLLMGAVTGCGSDKGKKKKEKYKNNPVPWRFGFSGPFCGRG